MGLSPDALTNLIDGIKTLEAARSAYAATIQDAAAAADALRENQRRARVTIHALESIAPRATLAHREVVSKLRVARRVGQQKGQPAANVLAGSTDPGYRKGLGLWDSGLDVTLSRRPRAPKSLQITPSQIPTNPESQIPNHFLERISGLWAPISKFSAISRQLSASEGRTGGTGRKGGMGREELERLDDDPWQGAFDAAGVKP